jgi:hypothetical protein
MITHQIIHQPEEPEPDATRKFKGKYGSEAHKKYIFERSWMRQTFQPGEWVKYRGQSHEIVDIYTHMSMPIEWKGLKPCYIELWNPKEKECILAHPSELKRTRK